jgi:hypothetical protein
MRAGARQQIDRTAFTENSLSLSAQPATDGSTFLVAKSDIPMGELKEQGCR